MTGTADWTISNGSSANADHSSATSGSVSFSQGANNRSFTYTSVGDAVDEDNETQPVNEPLIQTEQEPVERQIQEQEQVEESAPTITITSGGGY